MTIQTATIVAERPGPFLNANDRRHHMEQSKAVAVWRDAAFWLAKHHRLMCRGAVGPVEVFFEFGTKEPNKRRDPGNWYPTIKACCDGWTHACVWADDDSEHVKTYEPTFTDTIGPKQFRATFVWEDGK